ncbi:clp protease domain-containing protein [Purpureocillium lilacinum]|uniref:Clp protease domain-containing protein n=1 Tax=Purpureocillium lilacinum TaxID=33203 RepID=A0A179HQE2_PURLI|nr:clp protease domain-containing protein [Purpureocillium lilacinum]OAQ92214.1 clp protease domain-containing protein [Purpureocillium lilacinum]
MAGRQAVDFRLYLCKARVQCFGASLSSSQTYSEEIEAAGRATNSELPPRDSRWRRDYVTRTCGCLATSEDVSARCIGMKPSPGAVMAVAAKPYRVASLHAILCLHQLSSGAERKHASE